MTFLVIVSDFHGSLASCNVFRQEVIVKGNKLQFLSLILSALAVCVDIVDSVSVTMILSRLLCFSISLGVFYG